MYCACFSCLAFFTSLYTYFWQPLPSSAPLLHPLPCPFPTIAGAVGDINRAVETDACTVTGLAFNSAVSCKASCNCFHSMKHYQSFENIPADRELLTGLKDTHFSQSVPASLRNSDIASMQQVQKLLLLDFQRQHYQIQVFGPGRRIPKSHSSCSCCCYQFS